MAEKDLYSIVSGMEQCEMDCLSLASEHKFQELEKPLRELEKLLRDAEGEPKIEIDYYYFSMFFQRFNAGLYQDAGKQPQMKKHFLLGKEAAKKLESLLPMNQSPEEADVRKKNMARNCAEYAAIASLALETLDADAAWELAQQSARIYDWLWPNLTEKAAVPAVEIHLKLASLALLFKSDQKECERQRAIAREKYLELYKNTGDTAYHDLAEKAVSNASADETDFSPEMLKANPALAPVYHTTHYLSLAENAEDDDQSLFYFEKAALEAEKILPTLQLPEALSIAVFAFYCAVCCLEATSPERTKEFATQGLSVCAILEERGCTTTPPKELRSMRKKFEAVVNGKKSGFFKRIFG